MKKVVVFGGSGFLGSQVADLLSESGYEATIYDLKPSPFIKNNQKMIVGDILDRACVEKSLDGVDIVYNFAGIADITEANARPFKTIETNVMGNSTILEACSKQKVKRLMFASSIYVYSDSGSFYRCSKQACELLIECYHEKYGLDFTILRYGSLYGPRSDKRNSIHSMLTQALEQKRIVRDGDGEEIREYIHTHDAARMSVEALEDTYKNQHVIITGNQQMKIKDLHVMVKEMLKGDLSIKYIIPATEKEHYEITPYVFRPTLAKRLVLRHYIDLGQGILEMLNEIHASSIKARLKEVEQSAR